MNNKCKYPQKYYWDDFHNQHTYNCDEVPRDSGYCIFHDPEYLSEKLSDLENRIKILGSEFVKKMTNYKDNKTSNWLFIGHIIPGFALSNITIEQNIFFDYADIRGEIKLKALKLKKKASFQSTHFSGNLSILECEFSEANFSDCHFHKDSTIYNSIFHKGTSFHSAKYFDDFNCSNCKFAKVDFGYCHFMKEAQFNNNHFSGETHFHDTKFRMGEFNNSHFDSVLLFNVTDSDSIIITNSTINEIDIHAAKVKLLLQFWRSRFLKESDFSSSEFDGVVDFRKCIFEDHLNFESTIFGEVDFSESSFKSSAHFIESKFNKISYFNYVKFNRPEDIIFQRIDASNVSFANTDLSEINFLEDVRFGRDNEYEILDERRLLHPEQFENENKRSKINQGNVLAVYRGLRKNYESKLRFDEAKNFLNREKELGRGFNRNTPSGNANEYFSLDLEKLIKVNESNELEFKPRLVLENNTKPLNKIKVEVLQNIASFMNMENGGVLVLGIANDGKVCGIDQDIKSFPAKRQNLDNWFHHLDHLVESHIGGYYTQYISYKNETHYNMVVVRVKITKSEKPALLEYTDADTGMKKNEFYIRSNGRSIPLFGAAMIDYVKQHWR
jgi:uncharacterized protein YjbI with pentapeptide repeats